jgi:hypothetical protein
MVELCFPLHRVECTGWPSDVLESMPNVPVSRGEHTDVERFGIGHRCYIARDSLLYESPRFAGIRQRMHHYFKPGGLFCPAPAILAKARAWWESNMRGATFVVGVHGRAAIHHGSSDLESHIRLLTAEAEEEMRPGALVLLATCNSTIADSARERFGDRMRWRAPDTAISTGNDDWGSLVTGGIAAGALIDAVLLSMCDVVVAGGSNVMLYVAGLRPSLRIRIARHLRYAMPG